MDYVAGYVVFNDITARDIQRREMESGVFSFCKAIDTFCPLGPWIVTTDDIPDPHDLAMELRVNGESPDLALVRMSVTIPEIVAHSRPGVLRRGCAVHGDGVGCSRVLAGRGVAYLNPGDVMEAEIEKIGILRKPGDLVAEATANLPPAR
jgi:2-keto-4-pentenoate hydratase/2-oxohepta-3-ene-1,7-dioic acid hydratase in catechol pathway